MQLGKLLLSVLGATVLLGALVSSASARNFSISSQTNAVLWTRWNFIGGFDTVECEVEISGSFHSRTQVKSLGTLIGYITEGTVLRCARGSMTINQGSLPWHRRYFSFAGTLPRITGQSEVISGGEWTIREPVFGITCTVRNATVTRTYTISSGTVTGATESGGNRCGEFAGTVSGVTTTVTSGSGARLTVTLI